MNQNLSLLIELQKLDLEIDRDEKERKKVLAEADRYTKEIQEFTAGGLREQFVMKHLRILTLLPGGVLNNNVPKRLLS